MPSNQLGEIAKSFIFASGSNPSKKYETLQYMDGTTSCGCMGWTRRVAEDGTRSCKHTRLVEHGQAESEAVSVQDYTQGTNKKVKGTERFEATPAAPQKQAIAQTVSRKRQINW